jgi:hypothetical protein
VLLAASKLSQLSQLSISPASLAVASNCLPPLVIAYVFELFNLSLLLLM